MPSISRVASSALVALLTMSPCGTAHADAPLLLTARVTAPALDPGAAGSSSAHLDLALTLEATSSSAVAPDPTQHRSTRNVFAWTGIIGGGALLVAGGVLAIVFESARSKLNSERENNYGNGGVGATIEDPCDPAPGESNSATSSGCNAQNVARAVLVPEIAALGIGGVLAVVGIALLATDRSQEPSAKGTALGLKQWNLVPQFGSRSASLQLSASF